MCDDQIQNTPIVGVVEAWVYSFGYSTIIRSTADRLLLLVQTTISGDILRQDIGGFQRC